MQAITVCVNYSDFLSITLPANSKSFDDYVVVTSPEDAATKELCTLNGVKCVESKRLNDNGASFNKGCALNDGLRALSRKDWVVMLDADIVLPASFRSQLNGELHDPQCLYSARRRMCPTVEMWRNYLIDAERTTPFYRVEDSLGFKRNGPGATGYFVCVNSHSNLLAGDRPWLDENCPDASRVDIEFASRWRRRRHWLSFDVIHLGPAETNWRGRKSPRFAI